MCLRNGVFRDDPSLCGADQNDRDADRLHFETVSGRGNVSTEAVN